MPRARQQAQKTKGVGNEARSQQHGTTNRKNQPFSHFFRRQFATVEPFIRPQQRGQPLLAQQPGTDHRSQKHQPDGVQYTNHTAYLNQHGQLSHRQNNEKQKENGQNASYKNDADTQNVKPPVKDRKSTRLNSSHV